jgi:putative phosphoribosyl transferase
MPVRRPLFRDRRDAGVHLASALSAYQREDVVVLALPRGGVPVGVEVARALSAPLDVFVVRKLGIPGHEEFAMGAIAGGGWIVLDRGTIEELGIGRGDLESVVRREAVELRRREQAYRGGRPSLEIRDRTVIVVDDGLATGSTMHAAVSALRKRNPMKIVVAVPVGSAEACERIGDVADEIICLERPKPFYGVGLWYEDFRPTTDEQVRGILVDTMGASPAAARAE